jgi:nucleotide-binding universal stress UspA family protein
MSTNQRYKKILVPLDGSGWSKRAIPHAADIARANEAEIILLHVFKPPTSEYADRIALAGQDSQIQELREQIKQDLMGTRSEMRSEKMTVRTHLIEGSGVAHAICDYVREEEIDLVVMSTHGRTGLARFLFGSTAYQVMQGTQVPVLLIRPDRE